MVFVECYYALVIALMLLMVPAHGFPGASFSAFTAKERTYASTQSIVGDWDIEELQGITRQKSNSFKVSIHGVYLVGYKIKLNTLSHGAIRACVVVQKTSHCNALVSEFNITFESKQDKQHSLHAAGLLKLFAGDTIKIGVVSSVAWKGMPKSQFFAYLIQGHGASTAFYVTPSSANALKNDRSLLIRSWDAGKVDGSFKSTPSLSTKLGVFSVPKNGLYCISVNVIIKKRGGREGYYLALVNSNDKVETAIHDAFSDVATVTLQINTILKLQRGTRLFIYVKKNGQSSSWVSPRSSFSVGIFSQSMIYTAGFTLRSVLKGQYGAGVNVIDMGLFTDKVTGGFNTFKTDKGNGKIIYEAGDYLVCINFKVSVPSKSSSAITFQVNNKDIISNLLRNSSRFSVSACMTLRLVERGSFTIKAQSNAVHWSIESGSSVSLAMVNEMYPALSLSTPILSKTLSDIWVKVSRLVANRVNKGFSFGNDLIRDDYLIEQSGIYQVFANVIFNHLKSATVSACVAVNDKSKADGLFATRAVISDSCTLTISSAAYFEKGQRIGLFVKATALDYWELDTNTSLALAFIGRKDLVVGLQTTLFDDITQSYTGWNTPTNWNKPSDITSMPWSFATNAKMSQLGEFIVQVPGIYHVSANVIIGNANLVAEVSAFIGMITVNDLIGSDLLYLRQSGKLIPSQTDVRNEITLSISASLYLNKEDKVAVKVCSKADSLWIIRKETGFSIILVTQIKPKLSNAFLATSFNSSPVDVRLSIGNWSTSEKDPNLFAIGESLNLIEEKISFLENGMYAVSINVDLPKNENEDMFLGIIDKKTKRKIYCSKTSQVFVSSPISCNLLLYLERNTSLEVFVESSSRNGKAIIGGASYLSVLKLERPKSYPWLFAELKENVETLGRLTLSNLFKLRSGKLLGHDGFKLDSFPNKIIPTTSGYFIVSSNMVFDHTANAKCEFSIIESVSNSTLVSVVSRFDSTMRISQSTVSMSHILHINSNGIYQGIDAPGFFVNKKSSSSIAFIRRKPDEILSLKMLFDQDIRKKGMTTLTGWTATKTKSKSRSFAVTKEHLYFISMMLIADVSMDELQVSACVTPCPTALISWNIARRSHSTYTYSLAGVFKSRGSGGLLIKIRLADGQHFTLRKQSIMYITMLGDAAKETGLTSSLMLGPRPFSGAKFGFEVATKSIKFKNGMTAIDGAMIVRRTGIYLLSLAICVNSRKRSTYEVFITIDKEIRDSIYAKQEILSNDTISLTNSLYLQRGMVINVLITSSKNDVFAISPESRMSIMLLDDQDNNVDDKLLPVIYKDILPFHNHALPIGHSFTLKCHAVADGKIIYNWFRNGFLIGSGDSSVLKVAGQEVDTGEYYCEAVALDTIAISKPVRLDFFDIDECVKGSHKCTGKNQTCVNLPGSYKCACDNGFKFSQGKCLAYVDNPVAQQMPDENKDLPVAAVVLAPIAICVFVFLIIVALYTCYKNKQTAAQRTMIHTNSFSDRMRMHRYGDTVLSPEGQPLNEQGDNEQAVAIELNRQMENKDLREVRFNMETDLDMDNMESNDGSIAEWREDGYLSPRMRTL